MNILIVMFVCESSETLWSKYKRNTLIVYVHPQNLEFHGGLLMRKFYPWNLWTLYFALESSCKIDPPSDNDVVEAINSNASGFLPICESSDNIDGDYPTVAMHWIRLHWHWIPPFQNPKYQIHQIQKHRLNTQYTSTDFISDSFCSPWPLWSLKIVHILKKCVKMAHGKTGRSMLNCTWHSHHPKQCQ